MKKEDTRFSPTDTLKLMQDHPDFFKDVSNMLVQKKKYRIVINLPEWMRKLLRKESKRSGLTINEIFRIAVIDYLSKKRK